MGVQAERGMSAPPEVVFNTAIDPDRISAWLPVALRQETGRPDFSVEELRARWHTAGPPCCAAELWVEPIDAGGARVRLSIDADPPDQRLAEAADEALAGLAREVAENLTAG